MAPPLPACRYAELAARISLIRTGRPGVLPPIRCEITATHRVRIEESSPGIAWWVVGEVCVMCAHMARDLPGEFSGPWPIPAPAPPRPDFPAALRPAISP